MLPFSYFAMQHNCVEAKKKKNTRKRSVLDGIAILKTIHTPVKEEEVYEL